MQGTMVMPMVSYSAALDRCQVMMPTEIPQLTPLLASYPGDSFDPADPWFDSLDPSRQGASFSRRYGFVMDANTDLLPPDRELWIRKLSGSPGLNSYRCRNITPKAWDPVFGTADAPSALYWNGNMFHPGFTAPPGPQPLTATFEVYVVDTATGREVTDSGSGPLVFNWTNVTDGRPSLSLAPGLVVTWPAAAAANWVLECAEAPDASTWIAVTNTPVVVDNQCRVQVERDAGQEFFRMRHAP
jgi:hypothetical protein